MRLTILAVGSLGDVQPYVALGLGLRAAGHDVRIATHARFEPLVRQRGLEFFGITSDPQAILASSDGKALLTTGRNFYAFVHGFAEAIQPMALNILSDMWEACRGAEAVFLSPLGLAAYHLVRDRRIPTLAAFLQPMTRTHSWPAVWVPTGLQLGRTGNWLTHLLTEQIFWQLTRPFIANWQRTNAVSRSSAWGAYNEIYQKQAGILYGYSDEVVPRPADWGSNVCVTGYWFLDRPEAWQPPPGLQDFLDSGPPPVYLGFGSMHSFDIEARLEVALAALDRTHQRGILVTGWSGVSSGMLSDHVLKLDWVPHDWLFPRVALAVHHGGAGTTAAALRAGTPSIVLPFFFDQFFWGQRVAALGVGPWLRAQQRRSAEALADAIRNAVGDRDMGRRAQALGQRLRSHDGVGRAVQAFHDSLSGAAALPA